jgi:hypothetical protein
MNAGLMLINPLPICSAFYCCLIHFLQPQRTLHTPHLATPELQQQGAPPSPGSLSGVAQLLLFLSGSPDIGVGKTVAMTAPGGVGGHVARTPAGAAGRVVGPGSGDISRQVCSTGCVHQSLCSRPTVCIGSYASTEQEIGSS